MIRNLRFLIIGLLAFAGTARGAEVRYTLDGSAPKADSLLYTKPLRITQTTTVRAGTFDAQSRPVGFPDKVTLTRVRTVQRQSWLASLLAGHLVQPIPADKAGSANSAAATRDHPLQWAGMELVTISDFPDSIDASGGQPFGAFVVKVEPGSPGARADFQSGDTIIRAGSIEVRAVDDLVRALKTTTGAITCTVFRGYKHYQLTVEP